MLRWAVHVFDQTKESAVKRNEKGADVKGHVYLVESESCETVESDASSGDTVVGGATSQCQKGCKHSGVAS